MAHMGHADYPGLPRLSVVPTVGRVTIDHLSGTPVYVQLAALLRGQIERGEIEPDRPLPSYTTLIQQHEVARGTAAKAVQLLVGEGLVKIVPGRGAYVTKPSERP
jgi:GntR family transcriptional regulator